MTPERQTSTLPRVTSNAWAAIGPMASIALISRTGSSTRAGDLEHDVSVEEFLRGIKSERDLDEAARWFRLLVEGYDAADPARASLKEIIVEWNGPTLSGSSRPLGGYGPLLDTLVRSLDPARVDIRLQSIVEEIAWKPEAVVVSGRRHGERFSIEGSRRDRDGADHDAFEDSLLADARR